MDRHSDPAPEVVPSPAEVTSSDDDIETVPMPKTQRERELGTRSIEIVGEDGRVTVLQSSTMTAAGLKAFKAGVEKKGRKRRKSPIRL